MELSAGRHYRDDGRPEALSYQDIFYWARLSHRLQFVGGFEVAMLRKLDALFFEILRFPHQTPRYMAERDQPQVEDDVARQLREVFAMMKAAPKQDKSFL